MEMNMIETKNNLMDLKPRWIKRAAYIDKTTVTTQRPSMVKILAYNHYEPRDELSIQIRHIGKNDYQYVAFHEECVAIVSALKGLPSCSATVIKGA
jgi:hypothetical protein